MQSNQVSGDILGICAKAWLKACGVLTVMCTVTVAADHRHRFKTLISRDFYEGKELFEKSWEPGKPSPIGGDGLGPLYNETSCVGCHNLGGTGGGGSNERNVVMLTAIASSARSIHGATLFQGEMEDLHPGFRNRASVVLHRHATTPEIEERLKKIGEFTAVQTREGIKVLRDGRRNTPALFGAGFIDAIPDQVLRDAEKRSFPGFPEIKGRVSELADGRLGRFGWKGQIASLDDFVRAACSNELGLEVPGEHQASFAKTKDFDPSALELDLDKEQCDLLTRFVSRLAPPKKRPDDRTLPPWGYMVFQSIGCATCHTPKLGDVSGLYSDLLLHDMGQTSSDSATYYGGPVAPQSSGDVAKATPQAPRSGMAAPTEWRTPPLWGVADSAPYMHDGRAVTLDDAIRRHDGEAAKTMIQYIRADSRDRRALLTFLSSLTVSAERKKPVASPRTRRVGGKMYSGPLAGPIDTGDEPGSAQP
jgi:CxxC motif-containing protein (DUF1111 family)